MISPVSGFKFDSINKFNYIKNNQVNTPPQRFVNNPRILFKDTVSFTGMSDHQGERPPCEPAEPGKR